MKLDDLRTVVNYNWDDELEDYQACANGSGNENWVFPALVGIRNFLEGTHHQPDDFLVEEEDE